MNRSYDNSAQSPKLKYSAAYSKGRELMLEPLYGCAEEALLRRVASPYGEPEGPSRGRARALSELEFRVGVGEWKVKIFSIET